MFAETPLVSPGESGSVAAAVVFGCYGSRQRGLEGSFGMWTFWKAEMRACLATMWGLLELELEEGALEGEDDAAGGCCADGLRGVEQCCGRRAEQG